MSEGNAAAAFGMEAFFLIACTEGAAFAVLRQGGGKEDRAARRIGGGRQIGAMRSFSLTLPML